MDRLRLGGQFANQSVGAEPIDTDDINELTLSCPGTEIQGIKIKYMFLTYRNPMKLFRWQKGRQKTGYDKMLLATAKRFPLPFDLYLLRFNEGSEVPSHKDLVQKGEHYRLNIILKKAKSGGDFLCSEALWQTSRIKYFRSDISEHAVTKVTKGTRYVLSLGWLKQRKQ